MTCPWQALRDPFVVAVLDSYPWWEKQQLHVKWGGSPPKALTLGIDVYRAALASVLNHDARTEQERRERAHAEAMESLTGPRSLHRRR